MKHVEHIPEPLLTLSKQNPGSLILPSTIPFFHIPIYHNEYPPDSSYVDTHYTQLRWESGEVNRSNYQQLVMTLSRVSLNLTVAIRNIAAEDDPRSTKHTLTIDSFGHRLMRTDANTEVIRGTYDGLDAQEIFKPVFAQALKEIVMKDVAEGDLLEFQNRSVAASELKAS